MTAVVNDKDDGHLMAAAALNGCDDSQLQDGSKAMVRRQGKEEDADTTIKRRRRRWRWRRRLAEVNGGDRRLWQQATAAGSGSGSSTCGSSGDRRLWWLRLAMEEKERVAAEEPSDCVFVLIAPAPPVKPQQLFFALE